MGGVRNGAAEEDWRWDLNPGVAVTKKGDHMAFGEKRREWENIVALGLPLP